MSHIGTSKILVPECAIGLPYNPMPSCCVPDVETYSGMQKHFELLCSCWTYSV